MTTLHWVIATILGVAAGVWSWLAERRKIRAALVQGYGEGWKACEEHRRAHGPDVDPDEMFDAGYECGLKVNVLRQPQSDDWNQGFEFGYRCADQPCPRCSPKSEQAVN
jgi:hypothetical protein